MALTLADVALATGFYLETDVRDGHLAHAVMVWWQWLTLVGVTAPQNEQREHDDPLHFHTPFQFAMSDELMERWDLSYV